MGTQQVYQNSNFQKMCPVRFNTTPVRTSLLQIPSSSKFNACRAYLFSLPFVYQNRPVPSHCTTPLLRYSKDRPFYSVTRTQENISQNPLVEESISFEKINPGWDHFQQPLSIVCPVVKVA